MKTIISFLFILILFLSTASATDPIKIKCIVDPKYTQEDQWVYWFCTIGNERIIADSCLLKKGQKTLSFKERVFEDDCFNSWITFSKSGPLQLWLTLAPEEHVTVYIEPELLVDAHAEGSIGSMENYERCKSMKHSKERIDFLESLVKLSNDSALNKSIQDSIAYYKNYLYGGSTFEQLKTTRSGKNYYSTFTLLKGQGKLTKSQIDSIENVMRAKFPNSQTIQRYFTKHTYAPATENNEWVLNRFREIADKYFRLNGTSKKVTNKAATEKEFLVRKDSAVYTVGSKVEDIDLCDRNGVSHKLSDIKKKYILIDFWASWCGPCCQSYPELLSAQKKFAEELCIYAVSIDADTTKWEKAMDRLDPDKLLTHVHVILGTDYAKKIQALFGITRIPANFLLDEDRKIIAVDLRGDSLENKMAELTKNK